MNGALGSVPSSLLPQQNRTGLSDEQAGKGIQGQGAWLLVCCSGALGLRASLHDDNGSLEPLLVSLLL